MTFAVVGAFLWEWSLANYGTSILRIAMCLLLMEFFVVCLLHAIAQRMIRKNQAHLAPNPIGADLLGLNAMRSFRASMSGQGGQTYGTYGKSSRRRSDNEYTMS